MKTKMPYRSAMAHAIDIMQRLEPAVDRMQYAGSLRRGKAEVGDIEIVCIPRVKHNLFGDLGCGACGTLLDEIIAGLVAQRVIHKPTKNGSKMKQFIIANMGPTVDLFIACLDNWGSILAIRTGPSDFSQRMVTAMRAGGVYVQGGMNGEHQGFVCTQKDNEPTPCRTEEEFFQMCGVAFIEPNRRA